MDRDDKIGLGAVAAVVILGFAATLGVILSRGKLRPGERTLSILEQVPAAEGAPGTPATPAFTHNVVTCIAAPHWSFHLRPTQRESREGSTVFPAGERCIVLERGTLSRMGADIYRVRIDRTGQEGWIYLFVFELSGACAGEPVTPPSQARLTAKQTAELQAEPQQRGPLGGDPHAKVIVPQVILTGGQS